MNEIPPFDTLETIPQARRNRWRSSLSVGSWKIGIIVASVMVLLALIGIGLASTNRKYAPTYWLCLVPVYGILCVSVAWMRSRTGEGNKTQILRQACHWLAIAAAIAIDFSIREKGEGNGITSGYSALLLLALGCFLAGVHLEWLFALVGVLLTATLLLVVKADQYLWLGVVLGIFIIASLFAMMRLISFSASSKGNDPHHSVSEK